MNYYYEVSNDIIRPRICSTLESAKQLTIHLAESDILFQKKYELLDEDLYFETNDEFDYIYLKPTVKLAEKNKDVYDFLAYYYWIVTRKEFDDTFLTN